MASDLRVGIIGAGQAGERHAVGFAVTEGTKITGIADVVEERAARLAGRFDAQAYTDWRDMIEAGVDILVCSLPHNMHVEPTLMAAERGAHVLMEKPIATTMKDTHTIIDACKRSGVKLTVSFVHRFREEAQLVKGWIDAGELGKPMVAHASMNGQRNNLPKWLESKEMAGGGVLAYTSIHAIDRLRWMIGGEITSVTAQTRYFEPGAEVEAGVSALFVFDNGATATLHSNAPIYRAQPSYWDTELYGDAGLGRLRGREWAELSNDRRQVHQETASFSERLGIHYNFARQAEAFVKAIRDDSEPVVTGEDGVAAWEVVLAVYQSADENRTVQL